jgi:hypothetical protein
VKPAVKLLDQFMKVGLVSPSLKAADLVKALINSGLIDAEPIVCEALLTIGNAFDADADDAAALLRQQKSGRPKNSSSYLAEDERLLMEGAFRHAFRDIQESDLLKICNPPEGTALEQVELERMGADFIRQFAAANTGKPHEIMHDLALIASGSFVPEHRRKRLVDRLNKLDVNRYGLASLPLIKLREDLKATPKGPARNRVRKKK